MPAEDDIRDRVDEHRATVHRTQRTALAFKNILNQRAGGVCMLPVLGKILQRQRD
jgi:hypothetical protein